MTTRFLTLRLPSGLFIHLDGDKSLMTEDGSPFIEQVGCTEEQAIREIICEVCYKIGSDRGRFRGEVWNNTMPLVEDFWCESESGDLRTWRRQSDGFIFHPVTLGDLRAVTRCGAVEVAVENGKKTFTARLSLGQDGVSFLGIASADEAIIDEVLGRYVIPVVRDFAELAPYISAEGTLTV